MDLSKEYLRDSFMAGAIDLGCDRKFLDGFVRIFAGEMEALIAVDHATYLTDRERDELIKLAKPNARSVSAHKMWVERVING